MLSTPPNSTLSVNALLRALTQNKSLQKAILIYNHHLQNSISPDHSTFTFVLKACSLLLAFPKGQELHCRIIKSGYHSDIFIQNSLLRLYAVSGNVAAVRRIFAGISEPDVVSWNCMITGFSRSGLAEEALLAFASMKVKPSPMTAVGILTACSKLRYLKLGKEIHAYSLKNHGGNNIILDNAVLDMYLRCGCLVSARQLFEKMSGRDVYSWTTMVGGCAQNGSYKEALGVFIRMIREGEVRPNEATLVSALSPIASQGALNLGKWVHHYMDENHHRIDGYVGNALVNMYAKCGDMEMALMVFNGLTSKDLVSWSSVIGGMAMNGHGMHALVLFSRMLCHGLHPDDVTFIGVLSACSHAGLIDQGSQCFIAMTNVYGIEPRMEHYACMVDLYGRAGLLEKAEAFIRNMHIEPDGHVWGSLLNACRIHGNVVICNHIRKHMLDLEVVSGGTLALLSNTYAGVDKWHVANNLREFMTLRGIRKKPGCSWIDVACT